MKRSRLKSLALAAAWGGAGLLCVAAADARPQYGLAKVASLPGDTGWDYLAFEQGGHRLFIAHGTRVDVIDTKHLTRIGEIADTPGVHGIALAPELRRGFISAGASSTIIEFDLQSLARLKEIKSTGENPDAIIYDRATQRVFAFNGRGRNATVLDARTAELIGTIELDAKPEFAAADGKGRVYVNLEDKNALAVIDSRALALVSVWPLTGCEDPSGLALNVAAGQVYSVCSNRLMVVTDAASGRILGTAPIGAGADAAAYDPGASLAFASCGEGVLTAVTPTATGAAEVAQSVPTQRGARTMALDERTHRIYLVTASYGEPPAPSAEHPHPRPPILAGTFRLLAVYPHHEKVTAILEGKAK
jgi:DNA-binding beta-propeller fold protein YncE